MKIFMGLIIGLCFCVAHGQVMVGNNYVVSYPVLVTQQVMVPVYQPVVIQYVPVYQPVVVQNIAVPVNYTGNWPNVIVSDTFFKRPFCNRWHREYRYSY